MIIDAKDLIAGRLASKVAKLALLGNKIDIVNSRDAVITGKREMVFAKFREKYIRGSARKGPFYPRLSDKMLKRIIRGMLPYKQEKGLMALKRIKCYKGLPEEFKGKEIVSLKEAHMSKVTRTRTVKLSEICKFLGGN